MRPSMKERLRILVTGATGPYGAHFAKLCISRGHDVFSIRHTNKPNDSASLLGISDKITWATGDIRDTKFLATCLASWEIQAVAHFAALPLVRTGTLIAEPVFDINTMGTVALLDATKQIVHGGRQINFLFVSTDKALGYAGDVPYTEDMPTLGTGIYEASKVAAEAACRAYHAQGLVPHLVISRSCNVVATADLSWRLIPNTCRQFICSTPAKVFTKGQYVREYMHVDDAVEAQYTLMMRADELAGEIFHIGSGHRWTQEEAIEHIHEKHFPEGVVSRVDPPAYHRIEIPYQILNSSKLRRVTGWAPKKTVEEAVADLVAWWREHKQLAPWSML